MLNLGRIFSTTPTTKRFRTADNVVTTEQADTTILLDLNSGRYHTLNPVGGLIWSVLANGASMENVITRVRGQFGAPDEEVDHDVEEFVGSLLSAKLIRRDR